MHEKCTVQIQLNSAPLRFFIKITLHPNILLHTACNSGKTSSAVEKMNLEKHVCFLKRYMFSGNIVWNTRNLIEKYEEFMTMFFLVV